MLPLEMIKNGIINNDMQLVSSGYKHLTGEEIIVSKAKKSQDILKLIKQLKLILNKYENNTAFDESLKNEELIEDKEEMINPIVIQNSDKSKTGYYGNQTQLITEEATKEEIEANKQRAAKTKKSKRQPSSFEGQCSECGKTIRIYHNNKEFGQKCSGCIKNMHPQN